MNVGQKIQRKRKFRGLKQSELAKLIGLGEKAQARIGQYESGYRFPSDKTLEKISKALDVSIYSLQDMKLGTTIELVELFFWLEEESPGLLHAFQMKRFPGERVNTTQDINVYYHDNMHWPAHAPHGFWLEYGSVFDDCLAEWAFRQNELRIGLITREEYFEWKINWPETSDDCGQRIPLKDWRKQPAEGRQEKELAILRNLLPKTYANIEVIPDLQRLPDEQFALLVPDLLAWLKDPQYQLSNYIADLLAEREKLIMPEVEKIMVGEDEKWKTNLRLILMPRMEKTRKPFR